MLECWYNEQCDSKNLSECKRSRRQGLSIYAGLRLVESASPVAKMDVQAYVDVGAKEGLSTRERQEQSRTVELGRRSRVLEMELEIL